jgi:hypothetical protein
VPNFTAGTSFTDGVTNDVTAAKLNALVADAVPTSSLALASTTGTISNFTASTANITLGTIPTLTAGTTTGTAGIFTSGTIATLNSTTGTIPTLVATTLITTGTGTAAAPAIVPTGDTNTGIFFPAADTIAFAEGGAEAVRINSSGQVGIGTTSPSARLTAKAIGNAYANSAALSLVGTDNQTSYITPVGGSLFVSNDGSTDQLVLSSSGNLGVGTASPAYPLAVSSAASTQIQIKAGNANASSLLLGDTDSAAIGRIQYDHGTDSMALWTNSAERLRINSSGNLLVGTTSANPSGASSDGRVVINTANGGQSALTCYNLGTGATNIISLENGNGQVGRIQISGSATSYLTSSDYRLKENVQPMTGALARVASLKPCTFKWKIDGTDGQGFVAHELKEVCPDAVGGEKDAVNAQGGIEPQGVDQSKIVPLLTAALKEAIAKIETLEAKVTALEAA